MILRYLLMKCTGKVWIQLEEAANVRHSYFPSMLLKLHINAYFYAKEPWTAIETKLFSSFKQITPFHYFR